MLQVEALHGGWGPTLVVEDLGFTLAAGETLAIVGRNGVGKSTLLELLMGRARHCAGRIVLAGADIARAPVHRRAQLGLALVPQSREVFPSLTVAEHLEIAYRPRAQPSGAARDAAGDGAGGVAARGAGATQPWTVERVLKLFPRLAERRASLGSQLSGGEQQMLAIARALLGNPKVLLMDEPFEGLAPLIVETLVRSIRDIVGTGSIALVLVEQHVDLALDLAERCLVMDRGRAVHAGPSAELLEDEVRLAALMGLEAIEDNT